MNFKGVIMTKKEWKLVKLKILKELNDMLFLLNEENKWCRLALARDIEGNILPNSYMEEATSFCLMGAAYRLGISEETINLLNRCANEENFIDIVELNDKTSYKIVIMFLNEVLKFVKRK